MRRLLGACAAILITAACAGQSTGNPCVLKLDVKDPTANLQLNNTTTVLATLTTKSGDCSASQLKSNVTWEASNTNVLTIHFSEPLLASTVTSASILLTHSDGHAVAATLATNANVVTVTPAP